jgi:hypothetical protein
MPAKAAIDGDLVDGDVSSTPPQKKTRAPRPRKRPDIATA